MKYIFPILVCAICFVGKGQDKTLDSLYRVVGSNSHDTAKIKAILTIAQYTYVSDADSTIKLIHRAEKLAEKLNYDRGLGEIYGWLGYLYNVKNDNHKAVEYNLKSIPILERLNEKQTVAVVYSNIGMNYHHLGEVKNAISNYRKSIDISTRIKDTATIALAIGNLASLYELQEDYALAVKFHREALSLKLPTGDTNQIGLTLSNIGKSLYDLGKTDHAIDTLNLAMNMLCRPQDKRVRAYVFANLGACYHRLKEYGTARSYYERAYTIRDSLGDKQGMTHSLANLGDLAKDEGKLTEAIRYFELSKTYATEMDNTDFTKRAAQFLSDLYARTGDFKKAYENHVLFMNAKDAIRNKENEELVIQQRYRYEYQKKAVADSIRNLEAQKVKDAQIQLKEAENKEQRQRSYFLYGVLALALLFGGIVFNRFRVTNKQKRVIEDQKKRVDEAYDQLEEKNNEILDSINYAKRIQNAILPAPDRMRELLPENFVLYLPKDIVAGDFYWLEPLPEGAVFAVADCTGHGVPGAMVSVVCHNALNRSVREFGLTDPGKILDKTRQLVVSEFAKSSDDVKDGMDIALVVFNKKSRTLRYAGANNPLWIYRNGVIEEVRPDKQPIGVSEAITDFTTHTVQLAPGDQFYLFSDGFADQFGGDKGKKLKLKNLKELILRSADQPMRDQKAVLESSFTEWRRDYEQIDDVCVFGCKVT